MQAVTTIGLDIAKSVFQIHGVDAVGNVIVRRQLKRRYVLPLFQKLPPCLIGIEACSSSHHWSRELKALGHTVRLMPAAYVKPYVKRQKNDAADAEAICELELSWTLSHTEDYHLRVRLVRAVFDLCGCCSLFRSVNDFKQAGCAHADANAHRDNAIFRPASPALDQDVAGKSRPSRPIRVAH